MLEGRTKLIKGYLFATPLLVVLALAVLFPAVYNLGIAFRGLGQEAKSVQHFREVAESFPGSAYGKAAQKALEERRRGKKKHTTPSEPED